MEAERAEPCSAADQPCDFPAACNVAESLGSLPGWDQARGRASVSGEFFSQRGEPSGLHAYHAGSGTSFSRGGQGSEQNLCGAGSARMGDWENASCMLDDLSDADYLSPFRLSQDCQHVPEAGTDMSQAGDLFNALDAELNWEEVIEEFMQDSAMPDEMSIIEQFMEAAEAQIAPRPDNRDMYQHYMQRGQEARRSAISAGPAQVY